MYLTLSIVTVPLVFFASLRGAFAIRKIVSSSCLHSLKHLPEMPFIHTSITKTAHDALLAKQSAVRAGYMIGDKVYRELLMTSMLQPKSQQAPLVHAGYAVRVACVLQTIQSFVNFYKCQDCATTVILLGAGLDVTGLWTALRFSHVIEIDVPEICQIKAEQLKNSAHFIESRTSITTNMVYQGKTAAGRIYTLLAADLRNKDSWGEELINLLSDEDSNTSSACLVLSELVMSYLDTQSCDSILEFFSTLPNSSFVAFEPLGSKNDGRDNSVLDEYKRAYIHHFQNKLNKGSTSNSSSGTLFPLGNCAEEVASRLKQYFPRAYVTSAGRAAASHGISLCIPEPFDEHIALTLHLQSYVLACAFSSRTETLLQRMMSPWSVGYAPKEIPGRKVWIAPLELEDEAAIRTLFSGSYQELFKAFPSINKMVQTALKKDMAMTTDGSSTSQMRKWFCDRGGDFFVAVQVNSRKVLGGIAVRKCSVKAKPTENIVDRREVFELHRLVVHPDWYQRGIGRALLEAVQRQITIGRGDALLTATTFARLEGANHFYSSCGFGLHEQFQLGDLPMHSYRKEIRKESL